MKVVFRTDASLQIGTGHVMRCLTLADALTSKGAECQFICRVHEGHLNEIIRAKGYIAHELKIANNGTEATIPIGTKSSLSKFDHSQWLGATQSEDSNACASILREQIPDWLIVDHYALDASWERSMESYYRKLMVIDDLADRHHICDLLVDQTFGRKDEDYISLLPNSCKLLCGTQYALLRPEFSVMRPYSVSRRSKPELREILITLGGVDKDNVTLRVMQSLITCSLPSYCNITVIMGSTSPWLEVVSKQAQTMPWPTRVLIGVKEIAQLMADSDLAIGAAGSTAWERCCLGLPTIMLVVAENQKKVAEGLEQSGGVRLFQVDQLESTELRDLMRTLINDPNQLIKMTECAAKVVNGSGVDEVVKEMEK